MNTKVIFPNGVYNGEAELVCHEGNVDYYNREGYGIMEYQGGMKYEGYWKNNERCGKGKITYADGDVYIGTFCRNRKHGDGVLYRTNGDVYKMTFMFDRVTAREKIKNAKNTLSNNDNTTKNINSIEK